jgi:hypothetical protein
VGSVVDLDTVIRNPADSQHVKATYLHIYNTTCKLLFASVLADEFVLAGADPGHGVR